MTKQSSIPMLITRPEPQASRFAAELIRILQRAQPSVAVELVIAPLMKAEALPADLPLDLPPGAFAELVLTSETGAEMAGNLRRAGADLPQLALCVGTRTAAAAEAQGFTAVSAGGDAQDLVRLILARADRGALLYLHGEDRAADLAAALDGHRRVSSCAVYAQRAQALSAAAMALLSRPGPVVVPLMSPRSTRLLLDALPKNALAQLWPVTISANATAALPADLAKRAITAAHPDAASVAQGVILAISRLVSPPSP